MTHFVMGLDVGAGGGHCLLLNVDDGTVATASCPWKDPLLPDTGGWGVQLDTERIWRSLAEISRAVLKELRATPAQVVGIAASSMRHGTVLIDGDGCPMLAAPNRDARAAQQGLALARDRGEEFHRRTGHWPSPICSVARLLWLLDKDAACLERARALLSISDWVAYRLTSELATEPSQAGETLLFDVEARDWAWDLADSLAVPREILPPVRSAGTALGGLTGEAAVHLGLRTDDVLVAEPDTHRVPNSGPTVASRTAMVVGRLLERACDDLRARLGVDPGAADGELQRAIVSWHEQGRGALVGEARYEPPPGIVWDEKNYRGDAYGTFAWAAYVAEVEVDLRSYTARVTDFVAVQEIGRVLNPTLALGQIQGGVVQAIGWALTEECQLREGAMANNQLTNYVIPTAADVPPVKVVFLENPYPHGARGCKGLGELPMDGPAPAVANAIAEALGIEPHAIPLTPPRLMELMTP